MKFSVGDRVWGRLLREKDGREMLMRATVVKVHQHQVAVSFDDIRLTHTYSIYPDMDGSRSVWPMALLDQIAEAAE